MNLSEAEIGCSGIVHGPSEQRIYNVCITGFKWGFFQFHLHIVSHYICNLVFQRASVAQWVRRLVFGRVVSY